MLLTVCGTSTCPIIHCAGTPTTDNPTHSMVYPTTPHLYEQSWVFGVLWVVCSYEYLACCEWDAVLALTFGNMVSSHGLLLCLGTLPVQSTVRVHVSNNNVQMVCSCTRQVLCTVCVELCHQSWRLSVFRYVSNPMHLVYWNDVLEWALAVIVYMVSPWEVCLINQSCSIRYLLHWKDVLEWAHAVCWNDVLEWVHSVCLERSIQWWGMV